MAKPTPAEIYAQEKAGDWLYDEKGYCPFARHKLEFLLRLAHEAGTASVTKTSALTPLQQEVLLDILHYHLLGTDADMSVRLKIPFREAKDKRRIMERILPKLTTGKE